MKNTSNKDCLVFTAFKPILEKEAGVLDFLGNAAGQVGKALGLGGKPGASLRSTSLVDAAYNKASAARNEQDLDAAFQELAAAHAAVIQEIQQGQKQERDRNYQSFKANLQRMQAPGQPTPGTPATGQPAPAVPAQATPAQ